MICYKDRWYCKFYKECKHGNECSRALTKEVIKAANKWMENAPINVVVERPDCFNDKGIDK